MNARWASVSICVLGFFGLQTVISAVTQPPRCTISYTGTSVTYSCPYASTAVGISLEDFGQCSSAIITCSSDTQLACYTFSEAKDLHLWSGWGTLSPEQVGATVLGGSEGLAAVVMSVQRDQIKSIAYVATRAAASTAVNVSLELTGEIRSLTG